MAAPFLIFSGSSLRAAMLSLDGGGSAVLDDTGTAADGGSAATDGAGVVTGGVVGASDLPQPATKPVTMPSTSK